MGRFLILLLLFTATICHGQNWATGGRAGLITPNNIVGFKSVQVSDALNVELEQGVGCQFGGVIGRSVFSWLEAESGLLVTQRRFKVLPHLGNEIWLTQRSFEIPLNAHIYMRLTDEIKMGNSLGFCVDFFPSDIGENNGEVSTQLLRRNWWFLGIDAGHGYLWEGEKIGHYLGYKLHVPIGPMSQFNYGSADGDYQERIQASYLMLTYVIRGN